MIFRWYSFFRDFSSVMLCCGRGIEEEESSMAQGPARLKPRDRQRSEQNTHDRASRRSHSIADPSRQSSPRNVRAYSNDTYEDARLLRNTGDSNAASSFNNGAGKGHSTRKGAPEMGIKTIVMDDSSVEKTVEIFKSPGQTLGFYIREGDGIDRHDGVFISRIQMGTVAESNGLLRVGDEIISVNNVEVGKMSLDDVVILMSIPRKLILHIRSKKNCHKKNASCPSLAMTDREEPPIVVFKKGRASSTTQLEMTEKSPDVFEPYGSLPASTEPAEYLSKKRMDRPTSSQYASIFITPHKAEAKLITGDETVNDSENSSEGSLPRSIDSGGRDHYIGHRGYSSSIGHPEDNSGHLAPSFPLNQTDALDREYQRCLPSERRFTHQRSPSKSSTVSQPGTGGKPFFYGSGSDSDRGAYSDPYQPLSDYVSNRGYGEIKGRYQGGFREMLHTKAKYGKVSGSRSRSPECYNSDSEVVYTHPRGHHLAAVEPRGFASDYETYAGGGISDDDPVYSVPQISSSSSTELQVLLKKFNTLSHELQQEQTRLQRQLMARDKPGQMMSLPRAEGYCSDEYGTVYSSSSTSGITKSLSPVPNRRAAATQTPATAAQARQLLRKHSADCLLSYRTYQMEDPLGDTPQESRYASSQTYSASKGPPPPKVVPATSTSSTSTPVAPNRSKNIDTNGKTITRNSASRFRDLQLAKRPLQIPYGEFEFYKADLRKRVEFARTTGFDGALAVHVLCGQGLKSTKMTLRDLYCVISVDSLNKARTMIRTGAVNFDWDEAFDIELEDAKDISFLIYNWDPNYKHRLCFHGSVLLPGYLETNKKKNVSLKMEPKGLLYITLLYKEPKVYLQRVPSTWKGGLFGLDLDTVIRREGSRTAVPLIVSKCVEEVEKRGMDVVGIYRLCGSARRKAQLREVFEKNAHAVDLSPENVSDIHVVTGVLKDYLRELPEPLVTNALYQMLLDALSVRLPSDPDGSAKLMLSILECLPKANQETMAMVLNHLRKVATHNDKNKMALDQLAVCLGPVILCPSPSSSDNADLEFKKHIEVLKYLLEIWSDQNGKSEDSSVPSHAKVNSPRSGSSEASKPD